MVQQRMNPDLITNKQVALFNGCFTNYYYPEVGRVMVKVLEYGEVELIVPDRACCGRPMIAKGNSKGSDNAIAKNVKTRNQVISDGCIILTTCSALSIIMGTNCYFIQFFSLVQSGIET